MAYRHGVYVREQDTGVVAPASGTAGLQVAVGTAPVYLLDRPEEAVNTPILVQSLAEAMLAVGYHDDFARYTLCDAVSAAFQVVGAGPLVLINVLDPAKHSEAIPETELAVQDGAAVLHREGVLLGELVVKKDGEALTEGTDYLAEHTEDGVLLTLTADGKGAGAAALTVSGRALDPGKVTKADIVGGVDMATGKETGLEVVRQVFPKLGLTPGLLTAPRWSMEPEVAAVLQAKTTELNGVFRCQCIADMDSRAGGARVYTAVKEQKEAQGLSDPRCYAVWGYGKVGDAVYSGSALAAALQARTDSEQGDIPYVSPSNKTLTLGGMCLADGTEVLLDQAQANTVNGYGAATWLNLNGWRLWGNRTAAYPGKTDTKDSFFPCRRYMDWRANSFILTYFQRVDNPLNKRLIEAVVDSENVRGNSYVALGAAAKDSIEYREEENSVTDLMNGKVTFHHTITPYPPAEQMEDVIEFDPEALASTLA